MTPTSVNLLEKKENSPTSPAHRAHPGTDGRIYNFIKSGFLYPSPLIFNRDGLYKG
jgi:hypothetical protein